MPKSLVLDSYFESIELSHPILTKLQIPESNIVLQDFFTGIDVKKTNKKSEQKHFILKLLKPNIEVENSLKLQEIITKDLKEHGNSGFITQKNFEDFQALSTISLGITVGIFDKENQELVGQSAVSFKNLKDVMCDVPEESKIQTDYNPNIGDLNSFVENIFEVKGTMVHPSYRSIGLAKELNNYIVKIMQTMFLDQTMLMSEIATDNAINLHVSSASGFKALKKYIASDGVECYLLYNPISESLKEQFKNVKSLTDSKEIKTARESKKIC